MVFTLLSFDFKRLLLSKNIFKRTIYSTLRHFITFFVSNYPFFP